MFSQTLAYVLCLCYLLGQSFSTLMPDRDIENTLFVVNKNYTLSEDYAPEIDKIKAYGVTRDVRADLLSPLEQLIEGAKDDRIDLHIVSAYRSFAKQNKVFSKKMDKVGNKKAQELVAIPGASEHQLGLAVDVSYDNFMGINESFENTKQGKWVREHGYDYGFVVRYLREHEDITGYKYEPWHLRFVGLEHAQSIKELDEMPLESYVTKLRMEKISELLSLKSMAWRFDVPLDDLLSKYNDNLKNISQNQSNFILDESTHLDIVVLEQLKAWQKKAKHHGKTLAFESLTFDDGKPCPVCVHVESDDDTLAEMANFGFIEEDGYLRYVGIEIAQYMAENQLDFKHFSDIWTKAFTDYLNEGGKIENEM